MLESSQINTRLRKVGYRLGNAFTMKNAGNVFLVLGFLFLVFVPNLQKAIFGGVEIISESSRISAALLASLFGLLVQVKQVQEDIKGHIDARLPAVVNFVGDSDKAYRKIRDAIGSVRNVKSTVVAMETADYSGESLQLISEIYRAWLLNRYDGDWIDVVSPSVVFSGRYQEIDVNPAEINGAHLVKVLRHGTPMVNFMIMEHEDKEEVYFGWLPGSKWSPIFHSDNVKTVLVFKRYFEALEGHRLWGDAIAVDYAAKRTNSRIAGGDLVDKIGSWSTLSIRNERIETYGFFNIAIKANKPYKNRPSGLTLRGVVLDGDLKVVDEIKHNPDQIAHYTNKMFIEYGRPGASRGGFCFYEFTKPRDSENTYDDNVDGFFIDEGESARNVILGFRSSAKLDAFPATDRAGRARNTIEVLLKQKRITKQQYEVALARITSAQN